MTMPLFIHTYGRSYKQTTFSWFGEDLRARTYFVIQERERETWQSERGQRTWQGAGLLVLPDSIRTLSPTRQWILEYAAEHGMDKICMMDDDLRFSHRKPDNGTKLFQSEIKEMTRMFSVLEEALDLYLHAGISAREGNNRVEDSVKTITRMMRVLAYRPKAVLDLGCRFDRIRTKQDFDMTLQLLRRGQPNAVIYDYSQDQGGSQQEGGCATYRTPGMMAEDAQHLADLHPGFVKVVRKFTKGAWGGGERVDVNIQWKKAYESTSVNTGEYVKKISEQYGDGT